MSWVVTGEREREEQTNGEHLKKKKKFVLYNVPDPSWELLIFPIWGVSPGDSVPRSASALASESRVLADVHSVTMALNLSPWLRLPVHNLLREVGVSQTPLLYHAQYFLS